MMNKLILVFGSMLSIGYVNAQSHDGRPKDIKDHPTIKQYMANESAQPQIQVHQSEYFGMEVQIKDYLIHPEDLQLVPKSTGYTDKSLYLKDLNTWLKSHNQYVKPEKQNQAITE